MEISAYLNRILEHSRERLEKLNDEEKDESILLADIDDIRNKANEFLQKSINHFPGASSKSSDIYFPLLQSGDSIEVLYGDERYIKVKEQLGEKAVEYTARVNNLVKNDFNECLFLLKGATKHRIVDKIEPKAVFHSDYKVFGSVPVIVNKDRFSMPGFDVQGGGAISNCVFLPSGGGAVIVNNIEIGISENFLVIIKGGIEHKVKIKDFLETCTDCCYKIFEIWKEYV